MLPFELTKDTPYLALSGELWSVFYEYFNEIDRVIKGFYCRGKKYVQLHEYIDGLVQHCSISSVLALEILQSCTKPSIYRYNLW